MFHSSNTGQLWAKVNIVKCGDTIGQKWAFLDIYGHNWTKVGIFGHKWTQLDKSGNFWTYVDTIGQNWKTQKHEPKLAQFFFTSAGANSLLSQGTWLWRPTSTRSSSARCGGWCWSDMPTEVWCLTAGQTPTCSNSSTGSASSALLPSTSSTFPSRKWSPAHSRRQSQARFVSSRLSAWSTMWAEKHSSEPKCFPSWSTSSTSISSSRWVQCNLGGCNV